MEIILAITLIVLTLSGLYFLISGYKRLFVKGYHKELWKRRWGLENTEEEKTNMLFHKYGVGLDFLIMGIAGTFIGIFGIIQLIQDF